MTHDEYANAIADIDHHLEGDGFYLNIGLKSGRTMCDYRVVKVGSAITDLIRLDKDDFPPVYVPIASIEYLELSVG